MKMHTLNRTVLALLPVALISLSSCSSTPTAPPPNESSTQGAYKEGVPGGVFVNTVKASARVTAIDKAQRQLTLLGADGETFTVTVGPEAVNFDQVRVGDLVNATVTEQLVVSLRDKDAPAGGGDSALVMLAPKGAQPGGMMAGTTTVTAKVMAIDLKKRTATLQFEDGHTKTFHVRSDVDLTFRKVGEQVVFRVTNRVAINVEKP